MVVETLITVKVVVSDAGVFVALITTMGFVDDTVIDEENLNNTKLCNSWNPNTQVHVVK